MILNQINWWIIYLISIWKTKKIITFNIWIIMTAKINTIIIIIIIIIILIIIIIIIIIIPNLRMYLKPSKHHKIVIHRWVILVLHKIVSKKFY